MINELGHILERYTFNDDSSTTQGQYSPESDKIVFRSTRDDKFQIYVMEPDRSNLQKLSDGNGGGDLYPRWSSDGEKIVFQSYRNGNYDVYITDLEGTITRVTEASDYESNPDW